MTGHKKVESNAKSKLPDVPALVCDDRNKKKYKKGEFLGKVSQGNQYKIIIITRYIGFLQYVLKINKHFLFQMKY